METQSISQTQKTKECGRIGNLMHSLWQSLFHWELSFSLEKDTQLKIARVFKDLAAGLSALSATLEANKRIYVGLGMMGVVAPLSAMFYLLFDRTGGIDPTWYHVNYFHLFFLLGPHFFLFFSLLGAFLLFPWQSKRSYFLSVPAGYVMAKIVWLISLQSNEQLWQIVPGSLVFASILISITLFLAIDHLSWRQFHRIDAFKARNRALKNSAEHLSGDQFKEMILKNTNDQLEFFKQY